MDRIMKWRPEHHRRLIKCLRYFILFFLLIIVGGVIFHLIEYDQNEKLIKQNKDEALSNTNRYYKYIFRSTAYDWFSCSIMAF